MKEVKELSLDRAAVHIRNTCLDHRGFHPFFFMIGAGISHPSVPLAAAVVEECKRRIGTQQEPRDLSPMEKYSWWLQEAYHGPADRQLYFRRLIEKQPVSRANLLLAQLLLDRKISNLVVTTNFDDFVSRSLTLFGEPHIVCDHPETTHRIDLEKSDLQIVHVHGSYWFYDSCNLAGEIRTRSRRSPTRPFTMAALLDQFLRNRSPLVIGYSGWEKDVFMSALKRRLKSGLEYSLYWFCYQRASIQALPDELKFHDNVFFVVPPTPKTGDKQTESTLPASDVFEAFIQQFALDTPQLTRDPLAFYANHLRRSLPPTEVGVVERIERARQAVRASIEQTESRLQKVRDALRASEYRQAVTLAAEVPLADLDTLQLRELMDAARMAAARLWDNSPEELQAYNLIIQAGDILLTQRPDDSPVRERVASVMLLKAITLDQLNRSAEEIQTYDALVRRFSDAPEPAVREQVAKALLNKGITLGQLDRGDEEIQTYDTLLARFGQSSEPALFEQVAKALLNKAIALGQLGRSDEEVQTYDLLIQHPGQSSQPALQEEFAKALLYKGLTLSQLNRSEEAIQAYEALLARFGQTSEPGLLELVAGALNGIGVQILRAAKRLWAQGDEKAARARLAEAQQKFAAALQRAPDNARILGNQAYVLCLLGDSDAARPLLTRAIELGGEELRQDALTATETSPISQDEAFKTLLASIQPPPPSN
jgi:tetratricopeptide (TPR) repeat protein